MSEPTPNPSLLAQRSNPGATSRCPWVASSQELLAMTGGASLVIQTLVVKILDTSLPWKSGFNPASDRSCRGIGLAGPVRRGLRALRKKRSAYRSGYPQNRLFPSDFDVRARRGRGGRPNLFAGGEEICCIDNRKVGGSNPPGRLACLSVAQRQSMRPPQGVKQSRMFPGVHRDPW